MYHGVHLGPGIINRRVNHGFPGWILYFGHGSFAAGFGVVLFTNFKVLVDVDFDDMFWRHFTQRREHRFDEKSSRPRDARTDMTVVVGQALMEHDAVAEGDFLFDFFEILLAEFHLPPLSLSVHTACRSCFFSPANNL